MALLPEAAQVAIFTAFDHPGIRYDLSLALLRMERPALASAQAHLAIVAASASASAAAPALALAAAQLLDELPSVLEKMQRASLEAQPEAFSRVAVDATGASGDETPTPVLFPPPRGFT